MHTRDRYKLHLRDLAISLIIPSVILLIWLLITAYNRIPGYILPGPITLVIGGYDFIFGFLNHSPYSGTFWQHTLASSTRVLAGFLLAASLAVPAGIAAGSNPWVVKILDPPVQAIRSIPGISWLPLAIIWFGIGMQTTVFLIALAAFFPIYLSSLHGAKQVRLIWKRSAQMLGAGPRTIFVTIVLPGAMPSVVSGLRTGLGLSWAYVVLGELTGVPDGLGAMIMDARMLGQVEMILIGMIAIAVVGRLSDRLLLALLRAVAWRKEMV
jgi:NitT/TauT family transport system permease protein